MAPQIGYTLSELSGKQTLSDGNLRGSRLAASQDEQEARMIRALNVHGTSVTEVQLADPRAVRRKGLLVKLNEPALSLQDVDSPLSPGQMANDNKSAAAEDSAAERSLHQGKKSASATRQAQPNGCTPPESTDDTQAPTVNGTANHSSGATAIQTAENGTAENVREEAMYAQRAFYPLIRQLDEVEGLLSRRSKEAGESNVALAAARTWVMAAQTTVQELDANVSGILLDGNAASCLAPDWALYAQAAALKLRDLEEDLWGGQIFGQPVKPAPAKPGATGARRTTPRSTLSYTHHWRRKVAM
ncbi:hypothetical protein WJX73_006900 [Symbiochloris irregularis]|uniref:Uncharacterized protein n=1 Tax=Symbiochloris irregularis TaxID=706552 RepID=A0AAW1NWI9_9CHLO